MDLHFQSPTANENLLFSICGILIKSVHCKRSQKASGAVNPKKKKKKNIRKQYIFILRAFQSLVIS
jgi:hypothetical protein